MSRSLRQSKILELISSFDIETQEELVDRLTESGFVVTQATISRDIKQLALVKTISQNGKYKYVTAGNVDVVSTNKLLNVLREAVLSIVPAQNIVVVKTYGDSASAVANAIERLSLTDVVGVLSDRHTVMVICTDNGSASNVCEQIKSEL